MWFTRELDPRRPSAQAPHGPGSRIQLGSRSCDVVRAVRFKPAQRVNKHAQELHHLEERHFIKDNTAQTSEGKLCFHLKKKKNKIKKIIIFKHNGTKKKRNAAIIPTMGTLSEERLQHNMTSRTDCGDLKPKLIPRLSDPHSPERRRERKKKKEDHARTHARAASAGTLQEEHRKLLQLQISIFFSPTLSKQGRFYHTRRIFLHVFYHS